MCSAYGLVARMTASKSRHRFHLKYACNVQNGMAPHECTHRTDCALAPFKPPNASVSPLEKSEGVPGIAHHNLFNFADPLKATFPTSRSPGAHASPAGSQLGRPPALLNIRAKGNMACATELCIGFAGCMLDAKSLGPQQHFNSRRSPW